MNHLGLIVALILFFNSVESKTKEVLLAPDFLDSPKGMNGPSEIENEILTVKCSTKILVYIINHLYNQGFHIVSMSCNEPVEPIWVINYCSR